MSNGFAATPRANAAVIVLALLSGFWSEHGRSAERAAASAGGAAAVVEHAPQPAVLAAALP